MKSIIFLYSNLKLYCYDIEMNMKTEISLSEKRLRKEF